MSGDNSRDKPQQLWQDQKTGGTRMTAVQFEHRRREHEIRTRKMTVAYDLTCALLIVFLGIDFVREHDPLARTGLVLLAIGTAYSGYARHRRWSARDVPASAPPVTGLLAYRSELQRSLDDAREIWRIFAPLTPGAVVFASPAVAYLVEHPDQLIKVLPFFVVLAVWGAMVVPIQRRKLRKLQDEIHEIDRQLSD